MTTAQAKRCESCGLTIPPDQIRQIDSGEWICFSCLPRESLHEDSCTDPPARPSTISEPPATTQCWACKEPISAQAVKCPHCQSAQKKDNPDLLFALISFLVPLIGVILAVVFLCKQHPRDKTTGFWCLIWAVVGGVLGYYLWTQLFGDIF